MKKTVLLFACMFLLLLGGGRYINAGIYQLPNAPSQKNIETKHRVKFTSQETSNNYIEDADLGNSEDHPDDEVKGKVLDKLLLHKHSFLEGWYLALSCQSLLSHCQNNFKSFTSFHGQSHPIYIINRVLRL